MSAESSTEFSWRKTSQHVNSRQCRKSACAISTITEAWFVRSNGKSNKFFSKCNVLSFVSNLPKTRNFKPLPMKGFIIGCQHILLRNAGLLPLVSKVCLNWRLHQVDKIWLLAELWVFFPPALPANLQFYCRSDKAALVEEPRYFSEATNYLAIDSYNKSCYERCFSAFELIANLRTVESTWKVHNACSGMC